MSKDYEGYTKESVPKYVSSKFEYDLYNDEDNKVGQLIRIKRDTKKEEKWCFYENKRTLFMINVSELTEANAKYLRTIDGVLYFIKFCKTNIKDKKILKEKVLAELVRVAPNV